MIDYKDIITLEAGKTRRQALYSWITDYSLRIVLSYLAAGMTSDEIIADFPNLTQNDILACLSYAADRERHTTIISSLKLLFDNNLSPKLIILFLPLFREIV